MLNDECVCCVECEKCVEELPHNMYCISSVIEYNIMKVAQNIPIYTCSAGMLDMLRDYFLTVS